MSEVTEGEPASVQELIRTDQVLNQIAEDFEIEFQLNGEEFTGAQASRHFTERKAVSIARNLVIDKAVKVASTSA